MPPHGFEMREFATMVSDIFGYRKFKQEDHCYNYSTIIITLYIMWKFLTGEKFCQLNFNSPPALNIGESFNHANFYSLLM